MALVLVHQTKLQFTKRLTARWLETHKVKQSKIAEAARLVAIAEGVKP
jgi:hypothetical protein